MAGREMCANWKTSFPVRAFTSVNELSTWMTSPKNLQKPAGRGVKLKERLATAPAGGNPAAAHPARSGSL